MLLSVFALSQLFYSVLGLYGNRLTEAHLLSIKSGRVYYYMRIAATFLRSCLMLSQVVDRRKLVSDVSYKLSGPPFAVMLYLDLCFA